MLPTVVAFNIVAGRLGEVDGCIVGKTQLVPVVCIVVADGQQVFPVDPPTQPSGLPCGKNLLEVDGVFRSSGALHK